MSIPFSFPASKKLHFSRNGVGETRRIYIPLEREEYETIIDDRQQYRAKVDEFITKHPELFPQAITLGYKFYGTITSKKLLIKVRRIKLKNGQAFTLHPFFIMPYMTGFTDEVEKPLYLRKFGVSYSGLTYTFGRNDMYWYRLEKHIGRNSIVGTTIKHPSNLPKDLLADEKHSKENKHRVYLPITVAKGCILGISAVSQADCTNLFQSYSCFKKEARNIDPYYEPETVNIDGWDPTRWSWQSMFTFVTTILCFLHSFFKIRQHRNKIKPKYKQVCDLVWDAYRAISREDLYDKLIALKLWAQRNITNSHVLTAINKLCDKRRLFAQALDFPKAHRTSNMLDRLFDRLDRFLYTCKYLHGHRLSSEYLLRGWTIMHNFLPYCKRSKVSKSFISPAHRINGFVYHENWLKNLLISSSMGGFRQ